MFTDTFPDSLQFFRGLSRKIALYGVADYKNERK